MNVSLTKKVFYITVGVTSANEGAKSMLPSLAELTINVILN